MSFAATWAFALLLVVPLLALVRGFGKARARRQIEQLVALRLHPQLVGKTARDGVQFALMMGALASAIVALARPQGHEEAQERKGRGRDVIIAIDVSRSMLASDLPPSRLRRAKMAAGDLVKQLKGDRIGLVAFAGSAFLQAPVTADHAAVLSALEELDPEIIPLPGTNMTQALMCADEAFDYSEGGRRALVLFSDGEELEADAVAYARKLSERMRVFTVGLGSPEGTVLVIPSAQGGSEYVKDAAGNIVHSKLDEARLRQLAEAGGGFYTRLASGADEMRRLASEGIGAMEEHDVSLEGGMRAVEYYQWPLGLALLLFAAAVLVGSRSPERRAPLKAGAAAAVRAVRAVLLMGLLAMLEGRMQAAEGPVRKGGRALYEAGDYAGAQEAFKEELGEAPDSPERAFNLGAAAYKNGKWSEALEAFGKAVCSPDPALASRAEYNLANTLVQQARSGAKSGKAPSTKALEEALAHYDQALKWDPQFADAQANREFAQKLLSQPPPPPPPSSQQQQDKNKQEQKKDQQDSSKNSASQQQQQQQQQQSGDDSARNEQGEGSSGKPEPKDGAGDQDAQNDSKSAADRSPKGGTGDKDGKSQSAQTGESGDKDSQESQASRGPDSKPNGEIKEAPGGAGEKSSEKAEGTAAAARVGDGRMTRDQANALLESLRGEDKRVQLLAPASKGQSAAVREGKTW